MTRSALALLAALIPTVILAACGRSDAPDEPLFTIDQSTPAAAPDRALAGRWTATLDTSVEPRPLVLTIDFSAGPDVRMTSPSQGGAVISFDQVRLDGRSIAVATRLGALRFEGALDGADRIEGEIIQGGLAAPLVFHRAPDAPGDSGQPGRDAPP